MKKLTGKTISLIIVFTLILGTMNGVTLSFAAVDEEPAEANGNENWVSAWSTSMVDVTIQDVGENIEKIGVPSIYASSRVAIEPTMSGSKVRLVYSNEYGVSNLNITSSSIAVTAASP